MQGSLMTLQWACKCADRTGDRDRACNNFSETIYGPVLGCKQHTGWWLTICSIVGDCANWWGRACRHWLGQYHMSPIHLDAFLHEEGHL